MKKSKLSLHKLKVDSFVTLKPENAGTVKGGATANRSECLPEGCNPPSDPTYNYPACSNNCGTTDQPC